MSRIRPPKPLNSRTTRRVSMSMRRMTRSLQMAASILLSLWRMMESTEAGRTSVYSKLAVWKSKNFGKSTMSVIRPSHRCNYAHLLFHPTCLPLRCDLEHLSPVHLHTDGRSFWSRMKDGYRSRHRVDMALSRSIFVACPIAYSTY